MQRHAPLRSSAAQGVADEDAEACKQIGIHGAEKITEGMRISTHCNAGWLAFVDWGSAISPVYVAHRQGKKPFVFVDETKPRGQGARLTAWELAGEGVDHAVIADNATGFYMAHGEIDMVIVGSDRIAANGDVANKIGTYTSALAAHANGVPFYVAAPLQQSIGTVPAEKISPSRNVLQMKSTTPGGWRTMASSPVLEPHRNSLALETQRLM